MLQLGDGVKKWAVLAPAAVLPRAPRVAARRRLFARVELAAELEDLVIARLSPTFGYVPERASHPAQLAV